MTYLLCEAVFILKIFTIELSRMGFFYYEAVFIFRIAETVYKYIANTNATAFGQKMMNTQIKLNLEDEPLQKSERLSSCSYRSYS